MKRNIIYMVGALLSSAILTFSCSDDDAPTYNELSVDKTELLIKIDNPTAEVNITNGNGNYKISVKDESIATAVIEGNKILFTGLKNGMTTATVIDWTKHSSVINVRVKEDYVLALEKNELMLIKDVKATEQIGIISGNGGYKVESSDETIATATLTDDEKVEITVISNGYVDVTVTDMDGNKEVIKVTAAEHLFEIGDLPTETWEPSEVKEILIKSGNGDYEAIEGFDTEIASVEIVDNSIKITGNNKAGETTITIKDKMGFTIEIPVKVEYKIQVDKLILDWIVVGEEAEVNILVGSGDYEITSPSSVECILSDDNKKIIVKGKSQSSLQTITVKDRGWNQEVMIKVLIIDNRAFEDYGNARWYVNGSFQEGIKVSTISTEDGKEHIKVGTGKQPISNKPTNGYHISFTGGRGLGKKTNVSDLYKINATTGESKVHSITELEIVKKDDTTSDDKGKYWIRFKEEGREEYSYIITWF